MSSTSTRSRPGRAAGPLSCALLLGALIATLATPTARAEPLVQGATARHRQVARTIRGLQAQRAADLHRTSLAVAQLRVHLSRSPSPLMFGASRWRFILLHYRNAITRLRGRSVRRDHTVELRVKALRGERDRIALWLAEWGTLRTCPVAGPHEVTDNFGVTVDLPGVPIHVHQGNDILAPEGTPIVATFAGVASAGASSLGGLTVTVTGANGYAYNAHLSTYGRLGPVRTGDVIGYVGTTGDATSPHDHFEWHPAGGGAVDPNPLLSVVC